MHDLLDVLNRACAEEEPDFTELKQILVALLEDGRRHDYHSIHKPTLGVHAFAREDSGSKDVYCRYLFPKDFFVPTDDKKGIITEDPHRKISTISSSQKVTIF